MTEIETSRQNLSEQLQRVAEIDPIVNAASKIRFPSERDMLEAMVVELAKDRQRLIQAAIAENGYVRVPADGDGSVDKKLDKMMESAGMCMDIAPAHIAVCVPPGKFGELRSPFCHLPKGHDGPHVCGEDKWANDRDFRFEFEGEIWADLKALIGEGDLFENVKTVVQAKLDRMKADAAGHARKFTEEDKEAARSAIAGRIPGEAAKHPKED